MMKPNIQIFDTKDRLNLGALSHFSTVVENAMKARGVVHVALSGGSTPQGLFRVFAQRIYRDSIPWDSIHFFWCDERCVPPDNPQSNYGQAKGIFLNCVPVRPENIHRMRGELLPLAAAADYIDVLAKYGEYTQTWPTMDWVLLGMGEDGHTASLFPGQKNPEEETFPVMTVTADYQNRPTDRLTLTPLVFNAARNVVFLVTGGKKSTHVVKSLEWFV